MDEFTRLSSLARLWTDRPTDHGLLVGWFEVEGVIEDGWIHATDANSIP